MFLLLDPSVSKRVRKFWVSALTVYLEIRSDVYPVDRLAFFFGRINPTRATIEVYIFYHFLVEMLSASRCSLADIRYIRYR